MKFIDIGLNNHFLITKQIQNIVTEQFDKFLRTNDESSLDFSNRILKFNNSGLSLCWSYFKHAFEVRCNELNSPIDVFNSERLLRMVLEKF